MVRVAASIDPPTVVGGVGARGATRLARRDLRPRGLARDAPRRGRGGAFREAHFAASARFAPASRLGSRDASAEAKSSKKGKGTKGGGSGAGSGGDADPRVAGDEVDFDEDFDAFADDELMLTNDAGEAIGGGEDDIESDLDVFTADTEWGESALAAMRETLEDAEFDGALEIFTFKVSVERRRIYISIDAVRDKFGSPTLDELSAVSRKFNAKLEEKGFPDDVALEVASPGAERKLRLPGDLARFADAGLAMKVTYAEEDQAELLTKVLLMEALDEDAGTATFKLADVEENRPQAKKGQGMNKKQREWRATVKFEDMKKANLFVGF